MRTGVARTRQRIRDSGLGSAAGLLGASGLFPQLVSIYLIVRGAPPPRTRLGPHPQAKTGPPARLLLTRALLDSAKWQAPVTSYVLSAAPGRGFGPGRNQIMLTSDPDHPGGQFHSS